MPRTSARAARASSSRSSPSRSTWISAPARGSGLPQLVEPAGPVAARMGVDEEDAAPLRHGGSALPRSRRARSRAARPRARRAARRRTARRAAAQRPSSPTVSCGSYCHAALTRKSPISPKTTKRASRPAELSPPTTPFVRSPRSSTYHFSSNFCVTARYALKTAAARKAKPIAATSQRPAGHVSTSAVASRACAGLRRVAAGAVEQRQGRGRQPEIEHRAAEVAEALRDRAAARPLVLAVEERLREAPERVGGESEREREDQRGAEALVGDDLERAFAARRLAPRRRSRPRSRARRRARTRFPSRAGPRGRPRPSQRECLTSCACLAHGLDDALSVVERRHGGGTPRRMRATA